VKIRSPDYASFNDEEAALNDFLERIQFYENIYEQIDEVLDMNKSFIKIFNVGQRFLVNRVNGHIQSRVVYFLMNIHVLPRTIYLTRVRPLRLIWKTGQFYNVLFGVLSMAKPK
jgi:hypothetical protein